MRFFRQEYWSGLPFPLSGALPDPGIKPVSFVSPALAGRFFTSVSVESPYEQVYGNVYDNLDEVNKSLIKQVTQTDKIKKSV